MSHNSPNQIIKKPIITEKALRDRDNGRYHFWVAVWATKTQIKQAFQLIFSTPVLAARTISVKGKTKTDWKKRLTIKKPDRKKAIICLAKDRKIKILSTK